MAKTHTTGQSIENNLAQLSSANPMIDTDGNTYLVSSALEALAALLDQKQEITLDESQSYGVSILLASCAAALRKMQETST